MANPIPEGYELLSGRGRKNAIAALKAAEERGLDPQSVLTRGDGYLIPLADEIVSDSDEGEPVVLEADALEDLTVPELKDAAEKLGVDLEGATKKADIIAAIEKSDKAPVLGAENKGE